MATLWDDVVGHSAYDLKEKRELVLSDCATMSPAQVFDAAVIYTINHIESKYDIIAKGICNSDGSPFYATDMAEEYFRLVNT